MIVIDAGAFLEVLACSTAGLTVQRLIVADDARAPDLFDAEVFNRLVRAEKHGKLSRNDVDERLTVLADAPIDRVPTANLLPVARQFTASMSGYDALYVALAAVLDCPMATTDLRLAKTAVEQFDVSVLQLPTSGR
jgi:predicted nucleic acid-binding protein